MTNYNFDPYNGDNMMGVDDIENYLDDLVDEVSTELQDLFNISEEDALLFIEYNNNDLTCTPNTTKKQSKIIDRIYTAIDNVYNQKTRRKQWHEDGRLDKIKTLREVVDALNDYSADTLIKDDYFPTYAKELAEDIGAIKNDAVWPNTCIDWEQAADELLSDYSQIEINSVTYYYR